MPEKNITTGSKMSSNKCSCCPYGFHIDRDFVRYCDSLYNSAQLDKLRQHKRERRKEKKSVESYLGLCNLSLERNQNHRPFSRQNSVTYSSGKISQEIYLQNDGLKNAVIDFEDTWKKSLKKSFSSNNIGDGRNGIKQSECQVSFIRAPHDSLSSVNSEDMKDSKISFHTVPSRSSSTSSVSSQSTTQSHAGLPLISDDYCSAFVSGLNASLYSLSKPLNNMPHQTVGIHKSVLTNIRDQMASSLYRMKELEEQVKSIPVLKVKISALSEEKKSLLNELKFKENVISKAKYSGGGNELEKQLKKLENEGIMSPTLSRKCLFLRQHPDSLFSPAIASSLDATMVKKSFIENEIISHLKMNDMPDFSDKHKTKKSVGTSCTVLTRDIGVSYVPNKYKSIAVGNDFTLNDCLNLFNKGQEKIPSVSSGSLESDLDSLGGNEEIPRFSMEYRLKSLNLNKTSNDMNISLKACKDSSTNTEFNYVDKCIITDKENVIDAKRKYFTEKSFRHKGISVSPSVNNKYVQASNKCAVKHIGLQTTLDDAIKNIHSTQLYNVGVGDFTINDIMCDSCKKSKKTVGIGNSDINAMFCNKCQLNCSLSFTKTVGVGDFDIDVLNCKACHEKNLKSENFNVCSVGTNTSSEQSLASQNIHICDKCSATIHSVAQDLAAESKETFISKLHSNSSKVPKYKSKVAKLKYEIQPLKITQASSTVNNWTVIKGTEFIKKSLQDEKYSSENVTEEKYDIDLSTDTDNTTEKSLSSEILPNFTDLPVLPRKKNELNKEVRAACKVLNDHLQKADRSSEKKMLSSLKIIQTEWFKAANQKKADPHLIEDYLDAFEEFSKQLLHKIVNLSDTNGNTALHYGVSYGNFDVVSILIDSKVCDVNLKNKVSSYAILKLSKGSEFEYAFCSIWAMDFKISGRGDIIAQAKSKWHVDKNISIEGNTDIKYSYFAIGNETAGYTSIMLVALAEMRNDTHHYVVQRLFSIGDINMKASQNGQTALMLAVSHGKKDIVKILLDVGAESNLQDKDGSTALMCAAEHGFLDIAKILLSYPECDPTIVDNDGCTALTIAMEAGHKDIGLLIYTNMNFSRGSSPYSTLKTRKRSTPRSTPPPHTPTLRTPPLPSPATKSLSSLTSFQFPN